MMGTQHQPLVVMGCPLELVMILHVMVDPNHMNGHHDLFYFLTNGHASLLAHVCGYCQEMRWHSLPEMQHLFQEVVLSMLGEIGDFSIKAHCSAQPTKVKIPVLSTS
ncbi:unnamed protein product [Prunus armeniaca]